MLRYFASVLLIGLVLASWDETWHCEYIAANDWADCNCSNKEDIVEISCSKLNITMGLGEYAFSAKVNITCQEPVSHITPLPSLNFSKVFGLTIRNCLEPAEQLSGPNSGSGHTKVKGQPSKANGIAVIQTMLGLTLTPSKKYDGSMTKGERINYIQMLKEMALFNVTDLSYIHHRDSLTEVVRLHIIQNSMPWLNDKVFYNFTDLRDINMRSNQLTKLPGGLFENTKELKTLDLSHNRLENLPSELLHNVKQLKELNISHNLLSSLPDELFYNTNDLRELDLSHNLLININSHVLSYVGKLDRLNLAHNRLKRLGTAASPLFSVARTAYSWSIADFSVQLQFIDLTNNNLSRLDWDWSHLDRLDRIVLSNNSFQTFQAQNFSKIRRTMLIELDHNNIKRVNLGLYQTGPLDKVKPTVIVNLSNNPLNCDCNLHQFVKINQGSGSANFPDKRIEFSGPQSLTCGGPRRLKGRAVRDLSLEELTCQWNIDKCPELCRCLYQPEGRYTVVDCRGMGLNSLPQSLPVHPDSLQTRLIMADNQLGDITYNPVNWPNVTELDLSNTGLTSFTLPEGLGPLKKLYLNRNNLKSLSSETMQSLKSLDSLSLHRNTWRYKCEDLELVKLVYSRGNVGG